jgi:hypothetical protein
MRESCLIDEGLLACLSQRLGPFALQVHLTFVESAFIQSCMQELTQMPIPSALSSPTTSHRSLTFTMKSSLCILLLLLSECARTVMANREGSHGDVIYSKPHRRNLRIASNTKGKLQYCSLLATTNATFASSTGILRIHRTRLWSSFEAWRPLANNRAVRGTCDNRTACATLCRSHPFYAMEKDLCYCRSTASATSIATNSSSTSNTTTIATANTTLTSAGNPSTTSTPKCGRNARLVGGSTCQCLTGYEGNAAQGCTDRNECAAIAFNSSSPLPATLPKPACPSNQQCVNTVGSFTCQPKTCANPYGNPCGPVTACTDAPGGFICTPLYNATIICPGGGCPTTETCIPGSVSNNTVATCQCKAGHHRPISYLSCVPL